MFICFSWHTNKFQKSDAFVIPAIETTSSTVNLSQEEVVSSTPVVKSAEKGSAEAKKKPATTKPVLRSQAKAKTKTCPAIIKSRTSRPKTAPGLARREGLRKNVTEDNARPARHPAKRRSVSASRVESTPKPAIDINVKPAKRKGRTASRHEWQKIFARQG